MKAVKGAHSKGQVSLSETPPEPGPIEVLVIFPETTSDPWHEILAEQSPRRAFDAFAKECLRGIAEGKAKPLDLEQL